MMIVVGWTAMKWSIQAKDSFDRKMAVEIELRHCQNRQSARCQATQRVESLAAQRDAPAVEKQTDEDTAKSFSPLIYQLNRPQSSTLFSNTAMSGQPESSSAAARKALNANTSGTATDYELPWYLSRSWHWKRLTATDLRSGLRNIVLSILTMLWETRRRSNG